MHVRTRAVRAKCARTAKSLIQSTKASHACMHTDDTVFRALSARVHVGLTIGTLLLTATVWGLVGLHVRIGAQRYDKIIMMHQSHRHSIEEIHLGP